MGFSSGINGCGACGGFWKWFKPPHYKFFINPCTQHDVSYNAGGKSIDRHIADINLRYNMRDLVNLHFENRKPISRYWYLFLCNCYYIGVRIFGKKSFNFTEK